MAQGRGTSARPEDVRAAVLAIADWLRDPDNTEAPPKPLVAAAARACAHALEQGAPGHSVEVRVPPHVAIQCIEGPRHTRGTPPNVVELPPRSWLLLATGLASLEELCADGRGEASGSRAAEITRWMPIVPL
ncbi:hypothetical protein HT102_05225 [Hoyosella sp. G463]|uniref:Bacterial SCP orthologue domain-containing protein n=1 Tax=Lolliginicoccus lacisalsi TaxID=2742202 RepID=A0A927JAT9_9ACTN|nr:sterol carrier family protein [Lolliginicoccus lacisalsi]MBD8505883.1 hypothetical protein [Lolliginicoccus lacisalsi]